MEASPSNSHGMTRSLAFIYSFVNYFRTNAVMFLRSACVHLAGEFCHGLGILVPLILRFTWIFVDDLNHAPGVRSVQANRRLC